MSERKKTSIAMSPEVLKLLKVKAAERGYKMQDAIEIAIKRWAESSPKRSLKV